MNLSDEAQEWFNKIKKEYGIEDTPGLLLLQTACEAFDDMRQAQASMNEGGFIEDRFGQRKPDPAAKNARAARAQMLQALRALNLEIDPTTEK
ncbi:MAG TPA: hypothetical protein VJ964_03215 [Balneolaceae bacterium]|nr:hypothetical protein [Balneolaceae bacterium]